MTDAKRQGTGSSTANRRSSWRPALVPAVRWAQVALLALLVFAFARGVLWGTTTPSLWGPDEDYHFMYVDTVARDGRIIDPSRPLYSNEYSRTTERTQFNTYGLGPRTDYRGDPKASLRVLELLPAPAREGTAIGRGIGVVHPPLFHAVGAIPNRLSGDAALPARMWWVRAVSALWGTLAVYAAWLLASQVFRRHETPLLVGLLVATQPILGYLSGLVNHDVALSALFTLSCAQMCFILRSAPDWRQGALLGVLVGAALLIKASAAVLLVLAALTYVLLGFASRGWRSLLSPVVATLGAVLLVAGWWYVHARTAYGSFTGVVVPDAPAGMPAAPAPDAPVTRGYFDASLQEYALWTREWLADWYKTTFFHFFNFEAPGGRWYYFLPAVVLALGGASFLVMLGMRRRALRGDDPQLRQLLVLAAALPLLLVPFLVTDFGRKLAGAGFYVNAGRYVIPAYAAFVTCLLAGLLWAARRELRSVVGWALAVGSTALCVYVWRHHYVDRYFGETSLGEQFYRMSFDRPDFITRASISWLATVAAIALLATAAATIVGSRAFTRSRKVDGASTVSERRAA